MKLITALSILLLSTWPIFGQSDGSNSGVKKRFILNPWDNVNGFRIAPSYYKNFEVEASYLISSFPKNDPGYAIVALFIQNIGAGIEYLKIGDQNAFGAKISYEASFSFFSLQIGGDVITSNKDIQYRIMPRAGLSLFGIVTAYYGWNYNLIKESSLLPQEHVITLQFNILMR